MQVLHWLRTVSRMFQDAYGGHSVPWTRLLLLLLRLGEVDFLFRDPLRVEIPLFLPIFTSSHNMFEVPLI